jgi:micrococcal nuclease
MVHKKRKYTENTRNRFLIKLLVGIIMFLLVIALVLLYRYSPDEIQAGNLVMRVIDGDTIVMQDGWKVRLLCIDTPELGKAGSDEAKEFLEGLVLGKEVRLEKDISETDKYGRLLRYVYVNDSNGEEVFVNKEIVENGYGEVFRYEVDVKRCGEIGG